MARPLATPSPDDWKQATFEQMVRGDREVLAALRAAQLDVSRTLRAIEFLDSASANVRRAQLTLAKRRIQERMAELWRKVGDITAARRLEAANRLIDVGKQLDVFLLARAGLADAEGIAENFAASMRDTAESGLDRFGARVDGASYTPLSQRIYNSNVGLNGQIDRLVNSALVQGLSAKEFAATVRDFVNPKTPGGVRYAAMRLARTEINNSAHAVAIASVQEHPWVEKMDWHLSGSHPRTDICNTYKDQSPYPKERVPAKPHPQCFCFVVPALPSEEEFLDSLLAGHYDNFLEKYSPSPATEATRVAQASAPVKAVKAVPKAEEPLAGVRVFDTRGAKPAASSEFTEAYARKITKLDFTGERGDRVVAELMHQGSLTPKAANLLKGVRKYDEKFAKEQGLPVDAVAIYDPAFRNIYLSDATFTEAADRTLAKEVASNWSSKADEHAHAAENTIAHEFGHHIEIVMKRVGPQQLKGFWDGVASALGLRPPLLTSDAELDRWVAKNKSTIEREVSRYGATNHHEMLAEVWHEYSSHPSPRTAIGRIGAEMRRIVEL